MSEHKLIVFFTERYSDQGGDGDDRPGNTEEAGTVRIEITPGGKGSDKYGEGGDGRYPPVLVSSILHEQRLSRTQHPI